MSDNKTPVKERPHAVLRISTKKGNDARYAVSLILEDGTHRLRHDEDHEAVEVLAHHDNYNDAQAHRVRLGRRDNKYTGGGDLIKRAAGLPPFMEHLPQAPRARREMFLGLDIEVQEEVMYSLILATGVPRKKIAQWLFCSLDEIEHIDEDITVAARAELDLRIAKKMVGHALANNSPASQTATLYLTKVFLGWNEQGMAADSNADPMVNLGPAQSLFDDLSVVDTHRDKDGKTIEPPSVLQLVRVKKKAA